MKLDKEQRAELMRWAEAAQTITKQLLTASQLSEKGNVMVKSFIVDSFRRSAKMAHKLAEFCGENIPERNTDIDLPAARKEVGLVGIQPDDIQKPLQVDRKPEPIPWDMDEAMNGRR